MGVAAKGERRWFRLEIHRNDFNNDLPVPYFCFWCRSAIDVCLHSYPIIWKGTPMDCSEAATS